MEKRKYVILLIILLFFNSLIHAQQLKDSLVTHGLKNLFKLKVTLGIGLEYEKKISQKSVVTVFSGVIAGPLVNGFSFSTFFKNWGIVPHTYVEYRNYYNINKRIEKFKRTSNNSSNFLFARSQVSFPIKNQNYFNLLFVQGWGFQRSFCKKFTLEGHYGIIEHFYFDKPPSGGFHYILIEPLAMLSFNYVF